MGEQLYYIGRTRDFAYDYILWWGPAHNGYTYDLKKAGLYTAKEAESICGLRGEERAYKKEEVEQYIENAVSSAVLGRNKVTPAYDEQPYKSRYPAPVRAAESERDVEYDEEDYDGPNDGPNEVFDRRRHGTV